MSKVAQYLNEHILGEVFTNGAIRRQFSTDASVLTLLPEMVVYPMVTNDIRKIARFSWQLAEKGHTLPITARGAGSDQTGAALSKGVIVNTTAHMNNILEIDPKQRMVRLQPGVTFKGLNDALGLHGLQVPSYPASAAYSTIGGAIANNASGVLSGKYGDTGEWVHQLEVVLANGDILQTGRISKRELNRKKGLQTFEGEIYRKIDGLIMDHAELIDDKIASDVRDNAGYAGIANVKHRDGSIDLAPLFIGSQGTLGIISEVIMKSTLLATSQLVGAMAFSSLEVARDAVDELRSREPSMLEIIDAQLFEAAHKQGKKYTFYEAALEQGSVGAVVVFAFDDPSDRLRHKHAKKIKKAYEEVCVHMAFGDSEDAAVALLALRQVSAMTLEPSVDGVSAPPVLDGAYIPAQRFEDFTKSLKEMAKKHHVDLPLYGHGLEDIYYARPQLQLSKVTDKQKLVKLLGEYGALVDAHHGHLVAESGEGVLKASFAYEHLDDDVADLYTQIREVFDPQGILNQTAKRAVSVKELAGMLRAEYSLPQFAGQSLTN